MSSDAQPNTTLGKLLLTPTEVAQHLSLGRATVYQMIASEELPAVRVGRAIRVPVGALLRWIERRTEEQETR
jgi:excisionase family DNA binding protein